MPPKHYDGYEEIFWIPTTSKDDEKKSANEILSCHLLHRHLMTLKGEIKFYDGSRRNFSLTSFAAWRNSVATGEIWRQNQSEDFNFLGISEWWIYLENIARKSIKNLFPLSSESFLLKIKFDLWCFALVFNNECFFH